MRFTPDDLREALSHKDWLVHLISALTHEETQTEEGPPTQASLHGLPNVVSRSVVLETVEVTRMRVAVALGLVPVEALTSAFEEVEVEELVPVDLAALRLRELILGKGESAEENRVKLEKRIDWDRKIASVNDRLRSENQSPQNAENAEPEPPKGKLPDDFPHLVVLVEADPRIDTYAKLRKVIAAGTAERPWYQNVPNIGEARAADIEKALGIVQTPQIAENGGENQEGAGESESGASVQ